MVNPKLENKIALRQARALVSQNIDFDLDDFMNSVGPAPSFSERLGPTSECLSIDIIYAFHTNLIGQQQKLLVEQHISGCETCSGLLASYAELSPEQMPEELFVAVTSRMGSVARSKKAWFPFRLPRVPRFVAWVAAPALALLLLWIVYPARVYLKPGWVGSYTSQQERITIPSNPEQMQVLLDSLVADVNRGDVPAPRQFEWALKSVAAKSASPNDPRAKEWATFGTQLSALFAASHFESLRMREGGGAVPLGITSVEDEGGVPTIVIGNKKYLESEKTQALLEKSLRQSKIPRLLVYEGDRPVYEVTARNTRTLLPSDVAPKEPAKEQVKMPD